MTKLPFGNFVWLDPKRPECIEDDCDVDKLLKECALHWGKAPKGRSEHARD